MEQARRFQRRKLEAAAVIHNGVKYQFDKVAEISEGGLLLNINKPLANHERIEIQFMLPSRRYVSAIGEVIYSIGSAEGKRYVGVRFVRIEPQAQSWIRQYVEQQA